MSHRAAPHAPTTVAGVLYHDPLHRVRLTAAARADLHVGLNTYRDGRVRSPSSAQTTGGCERSFVTIELEYKTFCPVGCVWRQKVGRTQGERRAADEQPTLSNLAEDVECVMVLTKDNVCYHISSPN